MMPIQHEPPSDEQIYLRLSGGDREAFELLVARYYQPIVGYCYRRTSNPHLAEDLTQDVFTRLLTYSGEPPTQLRSWLYTIARNRIRDYFRSGCCRKTEPLPDETSFDPRAARLALRADLARLYQVEQRHDLAKAVQRLPPSMQEVLALRFTYDLSLEEIAARAGLPIGTVKSRLHRALRTLRPLVSAG